MNTSLLTFDGFPRSDIDVAQIRTTRARIIRLKNDHKALMAKLEIAVQEQFAAGKGADGASRNATDVASSQTAATVSATSSSGAPVIEPPFAKVNTVAAGSPAAQAGLQPGDKVIRFGTCNWTNHDRLSKVAQVVQQNENVSLNALLVNGIETYPLSSGPLLSGCYENHPETVFHKV